MNVATVLEYGVLFSDDVDTTLFEENDACCVIRRTAWDWLLKEAGTDEYKFLVRPFRRHGQVCLQLKNYVGVITTPCGCQIEVLPKINSCKGLKIKQFL